MREQNAFIPLIRVVSFCFYILAILISLPAFRIFIVPHQGILAFLLTASAFLPSLLCLSIALMLNPILVSHIKIKEGLQTGSDIDASRLSKVILGLILIGSSLPIAAIGFISFILSADGESMGLMLAVGGVFVLIILAILVIGLKFIISGFKRLPVSDFKTLD